MTSPGGQILVDQADLIESIAGEFVESEPMRLGSAFHAVFEDPDEYLDMWDDAHVYHCDGFTFDAQLVDKSVADIWAQCPIMEVPSTDTILQTVYGPVRISARADAIAGLNAYELKTTQRYPKPERYLDSMQWRAYVLAYGATSVTYRIVQLKHLKEPDIWTISNYETMTQYPYPQITQDVTYAATRLIEFINHHNLNEHRQEAA
ncbi:MAG: hypothetical protein P8M25_20975 [Paracoccaceae bacterium]|nr:hypothetical protein [Paracoccaceae bacterium]